MVPSRAALGETHGRQHTESPKPATHETVRTRTKPANHQPSSIYVCIGICCPSQTQPTTWLIFQSQWRTKKKGSIKGRTAVLQCNRRCCFTFPSSVRTTYLSPRSNPLVSLLVLNTLWDRLNERPHMTISATPMDAHGHDSTDSPISGSNGWAPREGKTFPVNLVLDFTTPQSRYPTSMESRSVFDYKG